MNAEGPPLQALTHRLSECPPDFLAEPRIASRGGVHIAAVVSDLIRDLGGEPLSGKGVDPFLGGTSAGERNRLRTILVAAWLLHDPWFRERECFAGAVGTFLAEGLADVAELIEASKLVADPDRREELVRLALKALGLRPQGESAVQAQDRLTTISSVERERVIEETRKAQARMREIREAMRKKAAEEAAAKASRE